ncbi:hypothetical protein pb186bvf_015757 [Paramecium bursaria]
MSIEAKEIFQIKKFYYAQNVTFEDFKQNELVRNLFPLILNKNNNYYKIIQFFVLDQQEAQIQMKLHVYQALLVLQKQFPDRDDIAGQIAQFKYQSFYHQPSSLHITTYFVQNEQSEYYKNFTKDVLQDIKIHAIAILPNKVIACVIHREEIKVPIENRYPHMTTLLNQWEAVDSNLLMANLFDQGKPLNNIYDSLFQDSTQDLAWAAKINGKGESNIDAYVVKFSQKLILKGKTDYGYD